MEKIPQNQTDVPVAETKAEEQKLEWGPELGRMSWYDAENKIAELNAGLLEGEKPWRLPTKDELVAEFNKAGKTPIDFQDDYYWSGTALTYDLEDSDHFHIVSMDKAYVYHDEKGVEYYIRLVR
ncbi:MAG: DUF1566 domain-containing protein [Candidatus Paceibacterota bacterium]|jgi:hypothetical protein